MPNVIPIGGKFKNTNDLGQYPSVSPQKKQTYANRLLDPQMFSPDQLKRNNIIYSTNKKAKWSSSFKKTG